jgi:hypothetical protein
MKHLRQRRTSKESQGELKEPDFPPWDGVTDDYKQG